MTISSQCISIGSNAFYNCASLNDIKFERKSHISSIGENAFSGCEKIKTFTIPDSLINLDSSCFGNAPNISNVIVPSSMHINSIRSGTFSNVDLINLVLEDDVIIDSIGDSVFEGKMIQNFTVNNDISLGLKVFKDCPLLSNVSFGIISQLGVKTFANCPNLKSIDLKFEYNNQARRVALSQTSIPASCFENCTNLERINIIGSITSIGPFAFMNCHSLHFPRLDSITQILDYSFFNCSSVQLPSQIHTIGMYAFYGTKVLDSYSKTKSTEIYLPSSISFLGNSCFNQTGIKSVFYPGVNNLTTEYEVFSPNVVVTVLFKYEYETLGGVIVNKIERGNPFESKNDNINKFYQNLYNIAGGVICHQVFISL